MRITIEVDEKLLNEVMELTGTWTQRAAVELALKELLKNYNPGDKVLSMVSKTALVAGAEK